MLDLLMWALSPVPGDPCDTPLMNLKPPMACVYPGQWTEVHNFVGPREIGDTCMDEEVALSFDGRPLLCTTFGWDYGP